MDEPIEVNAPSEQQLSLKQPIGEVVIGSVDPRTLSAEQFAESEELLFHGARGDFVFSSEFDYSSNEYFENNDGSQTLGEGFYTTDARSQAENYSRERKFPEVGTGPTVTTFLPYQARMFDFRQRSDTGDNGTVPKELFKKWHEYYANYWNTSQAEENRLWWIKSLENGYMNYLADLGQTDEFSLREMLETAPAPLLNSRNLPNPPWSRLFANFMRAQGYDGLIAVEGGEGPGKQIHASFVFFDLKKVGTYETWHDAPDEAPLSLNV